MSYTEYFDMYHKVQRKECPYRAFLFDVKDSRNEKVIPKILKGITNV